MSTPRGVVVFPAASEIYRLCIHNGPLRRIKSIAFHAANCCWLMPRCEKWEELPTGLGLKTTWNLLWTWSKPHIQYSSLLSWQKVTVCTTAELPDPREDVFPAFVRAFCFDCRLYRHPDVELNLPCQHIYSSRKLWFYL